VFVTSSCIKRMLCSQRASACSSRPSAAAGVRCDASVRPVPSRRALVQTSLHFAAALISGTAWTAWRAPCAVARVLEVRKGGAGERDVIVLSSGELMSRLFDACGTWRQAQPHNERGFAPGSGYAVQPQESWSPT